MQDTTGSLQLEANERLRESSKLLITQEVFEVTRTNLFHFISQVFIECSRPWTSWLPEGVALSLSIQV